LEIGNIVLSDVSAGFFTGEIKNQQVNYFGADLMRRFNWIFDVDKQFVYIKPSKFYNAPYLILN